MCTFTRDRTVMVCDVAIGGVRQELQVAFGSGVQYTVVDGEGTLVEAPEGASAARFRAIVQQAIDAAQQGS